MALTTTLGQWARAARERAFGIGVAVLALIEGTSLLTLARVHPVWGDEGNYSKVAMSFAQKGTFADPYRTGDFGFERANVAFGRLYTGALGLVYKALGFGVFQGRLMSYLCGVAILALVYAITLELQGSRTSAVWAAVLVSASYIFFDTTHTIRPEIALTLVATIALWVFMVGRRRDSMWLYALSGLIAGACADVHPNGISVPVAVAAVALWLLGWRDALRRFALPFGLGTAVGVTWWLAVHVAPDPALFFWQWNAWAGLATPPAVLLVRSPLKWLVTEAGKAFAPGTINAAFTPLAAYWAVFIASAYVLVAAAIERRRTRIDVPVRPETDSLRDAWVPVVYIVALTIAMTFAAAQRLQPYYVYAIPMIACGAILALPFARRITRIVVLTVIVGTVALNVAAVGYTSWKLRNADYGRFASEIRKYVPVGARVFGWQDLQFAFPDDELRGYTHEFYNAAPSGSYVVIGEDLVAASATGDPPLHDIIEQRGVLVGAVTDPVYGRNLSTSPRRPEYRTLIYRIR